MEIKENAQNDGNDNSLKNTLIIIFIILFAYFLEKKFNLKNIFFLFLFIILFFIGLKHFSQKIYDKMMLYITSKLKKYLFFFPEEKEIELVNKMKLETIKKNYTFGYLNNMKKINSNYNNYNNNTEMNNYQYNNFNNKNYAINYDYNYNYNNMKTDEFLANKIYNINEINKPDSMKVSHTKKPEINDEQEYIYNKNKANYNTFNNYNNYNAYNNYNNNKFKYNNNNNNKITNLPSFSNSNSNENNNDIKLKNRNIIANPFDDNTIIPNSNDDSSGNYFLLSNNRKKNKIIFPDTNDVNPINKFVYLINNDNSTSILESKIPKNKEISYHEYQLLKNTYKNTQSLNQNNNYYDYNKNINKIPKELMSIDYNNWMNKLKVFIFKNLIPNITTKHDTNISNLNSYLYHFGLKIITTLPTNDNNEYLNTLNKKLKYLKSNKINEIEDNNILYQQIKNNNINNINNINNFKNYYYNKDHNINDINNLFPSLNNYNATLNETKEINNTKDDEKKLKYIFFGDTNKIKNILSSIEKKINDLESHNNNYNKINTNFIHKKLMKTINYNNNPFINKNYTKTIDDYLININNDNNLTLSNLQILLYERIILNERLYPKELLNIQNETHILLVIEYAIERFRQLQQNFSVYGNGSRGGQFLNENWCSLLPTDSQLIAHLIINYIENIYLINNNNNDQQKFLISYPASYNIPIIENYSNIKNTSTVYLYQINSIESEPKFNVVYDNILIPCLLDEMNLFHAFCIYFYILDIKSKMFVMTLGIHDFIDNLIN